MEVKKESIESVPTATGDKPQDSQTEFKMQFVWRNVIFLMSLHVAALYGLFLMFSAAKGATNAFAIGYGFFGGFGITAGAHRLWAHRTYKATWQLRLILMLFQTLAFQNHIYEWCRDHRVHHKFTETDADPHNANRGFFFSHVGWLMVKKHPDVRNKGKTLDLSDLREDPFVMWQKKYYMLLMPILAFILPTWIPWYFWDENIFTSFLICAMTRYALSVNFTWLVNSAAHIWGNKPYDKDIGPVQNTMVAVLAYGEGWHNYHHVFPWDYKAAELGNYRTNITTGFIHIFAKIGWAYDMKEVTAEMARRRALRTGDGTHRGSNGTHHSGNGAHDDHQGNNVWGWGDVDLMQEDVKGVLISNQRKLARKAL